MEDYKWSIFKYGVDKRLHVVVDGGEMWDTILVAPQFPYHLKWFTSHRYINKKGKDYGTKVHNDR